MLMQSEPQETKRFTKLKKIQISFMNNSSLKLSMPSMIELISFNIRENLKLSNVFQKIR